MRKPILMFLSTAAIWLGTSAHAEFKNDGSILEDLINGNRIPLSDRRFREYTQICLVGYDLHGIRSEQCEEAQENSVIAIPKENAACVPLIKRRDLRKINLNVLLDGEIQCVDVLPGNSLFVVKGVPGIRYDRIDAQVSGR